MCEKQKDIYNEKQLSYYGVLVNYWFDSRTQETKFYVNVSFGGIGVLITILTILFNGDSSSLFTPIIIFFYLASIFCFLITAILGGITFRLNSNYIHELKESQENNNQTQPKSEKLMGTIDIFVYIAFYNGLLHALAFFLTFFFKKIYGG